VEEIELEIRQTKKASDQQRLFFPNKDFANQEIGDPSIKTLPIRRLAIPALKILPIGRLTIPALRLCQSGDWRSQP